MRNPFEKAEHGDPERNPSGCPGCAPKRASSLELPYIANRFNALTCIYSTPHIRSASVYNIVRNSARLGVKRYVRPAQPFWGARRPLQREAALSLVQKFATQTMHFWTAKPPKRLCESHSLPGTAGCFYRRPCLFLLRHLTFLTHSSRPFLQTALRFVTKFFLPEKLGQIGNNPQKCGGRPSLRVGGQLANNSTVDL